MIASLKSAENTAVSRHDANRLRHGLLCLTLFASFLGFAPETAAQIAMSPMELYEGERIRFNLSNLPVINSTEINVRFRSDPGTATLTADYKIPDWNKLANETTAWFEIEGLADNLNEGDETIQLEIGFDATTNFNADVTLKDGPRPGILLVSISGGSAITEGEDASFTLSASPPPNANLPVNVAITQSGEYLAPGQFIKRKVTVGASGAATFAVATNNDRVDEANGSIQVTVNAGDGYAVSDPSSATVTVSDNDDPIPVVRISGGAAVTEGERASFTLSASPTPSADLSVRVLVSSDNSDFSAQNELGFRNVTVNTSGTGAFAVPTIDDDEDEPNGFISALGLSGANYLIGTPPGASVAVSDNDDPDPSVTIAAASATATEGAAASFTVSASPAPATNLTVNLSVADAPHSDFVSAGDEGAGKTVTVPTTGSATYSVATANNSADEPNGPVTVTVETGNGYTVGSASAASVTVADNDTTTVTLSGAAGDLIEGDAKNILLTLGRGLRQGETLTAPLTFAGAATRNSDYALACPSPLPAGVTCSNLNSGSASVAFTGPATGTTATSVTIALTATADNVAEAAAETVQIGLGALTSTGLGGAARGVDNLADFTIADPAPPEANFAAASSSAAENAGAINVGVTLSFAPTANLTLNYTVGGSATAGSDYAALSGTVAVASGATTANIRVAITDDDAAERAETVTLTLAAGSGYAVGSTNVHTLTIQASDDPPPGTPSVTITAGPAVTEGAAANFTVSANPAPASSMTVNLTVAQSGDYGVQTGVRTVALDASGTTAFAVETTDDSTNEASGSVQVTVNAGDGYAVGSPSSATVAVNDNDDAVATLSASPNPASEGETITVVATLSQALATDVAIPLALTASTAEAGDYEPLASIAIAANETSGTGAIATNVDDDADDETLTVALGDLPDGMQPGAPSSVELTIKDAQSATSVEGEEEIPEAFALEQNYPNPFNPSTTIRFALDKAQRVRLAVYDLLGHEIRVLIDGVRPAARYDVAFDAADLASGTYLYVLETENQIGVKTMSLLK